jgi:glycerophosphoryl diester phosphodiesterase
MIFAHRGASGYAPENTMAAFQLALDLNSDGIELDLHLTKDGHIIICHDEALERTTSGKGFINDFTLEELRRLSAGLWFDERFKEERIPTLDEFLSLVSDTKLIVNFEIKNIPYYYTGIEEKLVQAVAAKQMIDRIIVSSFDHYALAATAKMNPEVKLGLLFSTRILEPWQYASQLPFASYSIHPDYTFIDEQYIRRCHEFGYKVYPYTVDNRDWYEKMRAAGLDGIFTNYPDLMK